MFMLINTCVLFCLANLDAEQVKMLSPLWQQKDSSGYDGVRYHQGWADMGSMLSRKAGLNLFKVSLKCDKACISMKYCL